MEALSSSAPAPSPAVHPKTSTSSAIPAPENTVDWGAVNQPLSQKQFDGLFERMATYWQGQDVFVQDCFAGADEATTLPIRVIAQRAWHALFARQLFVRPDPLRTDEHVPEWTVFFAPTFHADPDRDGTRSHTAIVINFTKKVVLIAGTEYAGELKKSIFTILRITSCRSRTFSPCIVRPIWMSVAASRYSSASQEPARPRFRPIQSAC